LDIVLSVLRFTDSDYPIGTFKLFFELLKSTTNNDSHFIDWVWIFKVTN